MKLKLIDIETDEEEVEFGTCELCFSTGTVSNPVFVFETDNGNQFKIDGYMWNWGDYDEIYIDNAIEFTAWLERFSFKPDAVFDEDWLWSLAFDYEYHRDRDLDDFSFAESLEL